MKDAMTTIWETEPGPTPPLQDELDGQRDFPLDAFRPVVPPADASPPNPVAAEPPYSAPGSRRVEHSYSAPTPPPPLPPTSSSPPTRRGGGRRTALAIVGVTALVGAGFGAGYYATNHAAAPSTPILSASSPTTAANGANPASGTSSANGTAGSVANSGGGTASQQPSTPLVQGSADEPAAAVAEALGPAVVQIELSQGLGSGVIYDKSGLVLTNAHVVNEGGNGGGTVKVRLQDGTALDGTVLGADSQADIAVVRVTSNKELPVARLATDKPKVGQVAIGIGSPFGLQETVTAGIVSAVDRPVSGESANGSGGGATINMLQTDAPINPGNSGGALANRRGEVIGINSAIYSQNGENNGIGFAIPIQTAKKVADKIVNGEPLEHGYLGVSSKASSDGQAGAVIANVSSGSPAAAAGLRTGDVITAVDGQAIKDPEDLSATIVGHSPRDEVKLDVRHSDGSTESITVQLGTRPTSQTGNGSGGSQSPSAPGQNGQNGQNGENGQNGQSQVPGGRLPGGSGQIPGGQGGSSGN